MTKKKQNINNQIQEKQKKYDLAGALRNLKPLVQQIVTKARKHVLDFLINVYNLDQKTARDIEKNVYSATKSRMMEKYSYDNLGINLDLLKTKDSKALIGFDAYPDVFGFIATALTIPMYQSFGDTLGYYNGKWEFNYGDINASPDYTNELISQFISLGGVNDISIVDWKSSDDTILYFETAIVVANFYYKVSQEEQEEQEGPDDRNAKGNSNHREQPKPEQPKQDQTELINFFGQTLRDQYLLAKPVISYRNPGQTTMNSLEIQENRSWNELPYNGKSIGAGSAMRSGSIGIFFPGGHNRDMLIALSVEASRITHNSATAILGSITAALFTAYALEKVPVINWPHKLLKLLKSNKIDTYMEKSRPNEYHLYNRDKIIYIGQWEKYVNFRFAGRKPRLDLLNMKNPVARFKYLSENFSKGCEIRGGCADDCLIMAYDALLECDGVFEKIIVYSILHPGDSDTVGSVALSWFGAVYHSSKNDILTQSKFSELEYYEILDELLNSNIVNMINIYYYDIYLNTSRKYLKKLVS